MVKHTQTTRADELSVFDHFLGLALKGLILELKFEVSLQAITQTEGNLEQYIYKMVYCRGGAKPILLSIVHFFFFRLSLNKIQFFFVFFCCFF